MPKDILVVVDMQNDFCAPEGTLSNAECTQAIERVNQLIACGDFSDIVYTLDTHSGETYLESQEGRHLPVVHCVEGTWGHDLAVNETAGALKVRKPAFGSLEVAQTVQRLVDEAGGPDQATVTFCGVCTDICVVSNVALVKALCPEVPVIVISDACAGVTPEKHEAALEVMRSIQCSVR